MGQMTVWNGTSDEMLDLTEVCKRNCECAVNDGVVRATCPTHAMLTDQRILDRLLFERFIVQKLKDEESLIRAV